MTPLGGPCSPGDSLPSLCSKFLSQPSPARLIKTIGKWLPPRRAWLPQAAAGAVPGGMLGNRRRPAGQKLASSSECELSS